jgi:RNA polymerase sigma factor (sigma-70 family)
MMDNTEGLKQSLETAYRDNRKGLLARANKSTRNLTDAEDVLQDAFLKALDNLDLLEKVENLTGWLFTVIRNLVIDLWRRNKTRKKAGETNVAEETIAEIVSSTGLDPSDELVRNELADALGDAILALPAEQREVIEAQVMDGVTFRELSESTGIPINTLMTRKKLAVRKLAAALRGWIED